MEGLTLHYAYQPLPIHSTTIYRNSFISADSAPILGMHAVKYVYTLSRQGSSLCVRADLLCVIYQPAP